MKSLSLYAKGRLNSLADHLSVYAHGPQPAALHEIRHQIKEVNAILNAGEFCVKGFHAKKQYRPFRSIFRMAGEIRQAEVIAELLRIYKIDTPEVHVDQKLISIFQNRLPESLLAIEQSRQEIIDSIKNIKQSCFKKYFNRKKKEIRKELYPKLNQTELHQTRKLLKEIICLSSVTKTAKKSLSFYDNLQALIGHWHDKQAVLQLLNQRRNSLALMRVKAECSSHIAEIKAIVNDFYN